MQTSLTLTSQQLALLLLLYRFRFLTRAQIQTLLNHKYHNRIIQWLHDLHQNQYITIHTNHQVPIYSLGSNGRRYLKTKEGVDISGLNRVWRETKYSHAFQARCLMVADICISLMKETSQKNQTLHFMTKVEMNGAEGLISPAPDAYIAIEEPNGEIRRYFLEVFTQAPKRVMQKRISEYFEYYDSNEWQTSTNKPFPEVILVCSSPKIKSFVSKVIDTENEDRPGLKFTIQ